MKRLFYLGYYFIKQDWAKLKKYTCHIHQTHSIAKDRLWFEMISNSLKYNISLLEYFQFGFFNKTHSEKKKWAGTGTMYEYQLQMNPKSERDVLDDKRKFFKTYAPFVIHRVATLDEIKNDQTLAKKILNNSSGKLVFKVADGKCGAQVEIRQTKEFSEKNLAEYMMKNNYDLVEEFIWQHPEMNRLSPSGVNTVRIITQLDDKNRVHILGCRQRISVNSNVDNLAAGNIVATIDEKTGKINSPALYSDITKEEISIHPVTGVQIPGFQIPFWQETIELAKEAALKNTRNRSIGWDIVITENGPGLIEGNHDWCKLVWQLPEKKGMKEILDNHLNALRKK